MLKAILVLLTVSFFLSASGQNIKSIEISLIGRHDQHANYVSNFAGRVYNDTNKLYGNSYGATIAYRRKINETISGFFGLGYYRLSIDKIRGPMPFNIPGVRTARNINYDDGFTNLLYSTNKYYYSDLSLSFGFNKTAVLKNNLHFDLGAEVIGYYSLSQRYHIGGSKYYTTHNSKPLEFGANATIGLLQEWKKFYIRPALLLPVYQNLKGDKVFYEDRNMNISKWFKGVGAKLCVGKYF